MAHHVYHTEGLVLRSIDTGEANRFVDVFTKELGLIRAVAKSVRRERSKLRYSLQDHTVLVVSLVRGRDVWRITGAKETTSVYLALREDKDKLTLFAHIALLLRRLLHGEEKNEQLFDIVMSCISYIRENVLSSRDLKGVEYVTVLRILRSLGYISGAEAYLVSTLYTPSFLEMVLDNEKKIVREINHALTESHL